MNHRLAEEIRFTDVTVTFSCHCGIVTRVKVMLIGKLQKLRLQDAARATSPY
jgi:hypothetical protein